MSVYDCGACAPANEGGIMEITKENSQKIADKLTEIFDLVSTLSDEELAYLGEVKTQIERDISRWKAGMGVLFDFNKADAKIKLAEQSLKRLRGLRDIHSAIETYWPINLEYATRRAKERQTEGAFGLEPR